MNVGAIQRAMRSVAGASGATLLMQVVSLVVGLGTSVVLSRMLGASGLGVYAFAFAVASVLGVVARLGLEPLLVREVSVAATRGDWSVVRGLSAFAHRSAIVAATAVGLLAAAAGAAFTDPVTARTLLVTVPFLVALSALAMTSAALRGLGDVVVAQFPVLLVRPVLFVGGLAVLWVWSVASPIAAMGVHAGAALVAWLCALVAWALLRPREVRDASPEYRARSWMSAALPLLAIGGLDILNNQIDLVMLKALASDASAGIYSVAVQLSRTTILVLGVVNAVVAPRFASLHASGDRAGLQKLVSQSTAGISAGTAPLVAALILFGPSVLTLYAEGFTAAYPALVVLVIAQMVNAFAGSVGFLMLMTGHEREVGLASFGAVILNVGLNLLLVPTLDLLGAAIASGAAVAAWNVLLVYRVRRVLGIESTALGWVRMQLAR